MVKVFCYIITSQSSCELNLFGFCPGYGSLRCITSFKYLPSYLVLRVSARLSQGLMSLFHAQLSVFPLFLDKLMSLSLSSSPSPSSRLLLLMTPYSLAWLWGPRRGDSCCLGPASPLGRLCVPWSPGWGFESDTVCPPAEGDSNGLASGWFPTLSPPPSCKGS